MKRCPVEDAGWAGVTVRADTSPWVSPLLLPEEAEGKSRLRPGGTGLQRDSELGHRKPV